MTQRLPENEGRNKSRGQSVIYVLAAGMVMCLLYLVSLSLWALTTNITTAGNSAMMVSLERGTQDGETD